MTRQQRTLVRCGLLVLAGSVALFAGGGQCDPEPGYDVGYRPGHAGLAHRPTAVWGDATVAPGPLEAACARWNEGADAPLFEPCAVEQATASGLDLLPLDDPGRIGTIVVSVGFVPDDGWGLCDWALDAEGRTLSATVVVSSDIAYHAATTEAVIIHELGEAIGLGHDRRLDSCMSDGDELPVPCTITDADLEAAHNGP